MFLRFTERGRRVLVLAKEEANRLGSDVIDSAHILLGLLDEPEGVAVKALQSLDVSLEAVRAGVERTVGAGDSSTARPQFTPRAKTLLELSLREALALGHNSVDTEHLLLSLLRQGDDPAAQVLVGFGADLPSVREQVVRLLTGHGLSPTAAEAGTTSRMSPLRSGQDEVTGPTASGRNPSRSFPEAPSVPSAPPDHQVNLVYEPDQDRLIGTLGVEPVEWELIRRHRVNGRIGAVGLDATWSIGNNYVPPPGGWTPHADYVSDFPNIPAVLHGSFAGQPVELRGVFHLSTQYAFERGSFVGRIGHVHLEATVLAASGGDSDSGTVVVEGTYGSAPFEIYASLDSPSRGVVHGTLDDAAVHLELLSPPLEYSYRDGRPHLERAGNHVVVTGAYPGPPELLAVMVGAALQFL